MHQGHRERFLELLDQAGSAAIISAGSPPIRNNDTEYRFRPDSDFVYLTGFHEPESVLVLVPRREEGRAILFARDKNRAEEVWTGRRLGLEAAPEALGVDEALPIECLWDELPELLLGHERVVYRSGFDEARDREMIHLLSDLRTPVRRGILAPVEWTEPVSTLHELRLKKSEAEVTLMRRAAEISTEAHLEAMRQAAPGTNETELDALLDYTFRRQGCTGSAYTNIVAGGANACILHYVENDQPLRDGDLVLIDAGAEWQYYASDVTRTFPVNGTFTDEQKALYEIVLASQQAAIAKVAPGQTPAAVHETALDVIVDGLMRLGLLEGSRDEILEQKSYDRFFMHKTGHWLGLDVHDVGAMYVEGKCRAFEPGMVTTVEPGIYVAEDDDSVDARWRGIGIRIEDDVLVTPEGNEVLSAGVPTEIDEVEATCREARLQPA